MECIFAMDDTTISATESPRTLDPRSPNECDSDERNAALAMRFNESFSPVLGPHQGLKKSLPQGPAGDPMVGKVDCDPGFGSSDSFTDASIVSRAETLLMAASPCNMRTSLLHDSRRRIWVHGPRPEYKKYGQRYNLPSRICALLRPKLDMIILPGNHDLTREYWEFCRDTLRLEEWQAVFTQGDLYNLDDNVSEEMINTILDVVRHSECGWTIIPYAVTNKFHRWASRFNGMNVQVFGESTEWTDRFGHKGALHRHIQSLHVPSVIEEMDPTNSIKVAAGYTCSTVDDLLEAHRLLGSGKVVVKPVFGAAGEGILFYSTTEELTSYTFPMGDVCLEEHLNLDCAPDGVCLSPALHYNEDKILGNEAVDQIMRGTSYFGWRKSCVNGEFQDAARDALEAFMTYSKPCGPGGVDFLSVDGQPVLSDLNTGRFNGAHGPKLFIQAYAPWCQFFCWKGITPASVTIQEYWQQLKDAGVAFQPNSSEEGVFPLLYLRGRSFMILALARTEERCLEFYRVADAIMEKNKT